MQRFETMKSILPKAAYERNAEIYKLLANSKRLEILNRIKSKEYTVDALAKALRVPKANVSQHLALLRHARLVRVRHNGKNAHYRISDPRIVEPCKILYQLWKE